MSELVRLYMFTFGLGFVQFFKGLEFYRCIENAWFLDHFEDLRGKHVLDIGSYKSPLPTYLAKERGAHVQVVDMEYGARIQRKYARKKGLTRFDFGCHFIPEFKSKEDIKFPMHSNTFDVVTCISTIEHFDFDGDTEVIREIARMLKPGGLVYVTIPYGKNYIEKVHHGWYERTYNYMSVVKRLHNPSGLTLTNEFFFKSESIGWFTKLYWKIPHKLRMALGRIWIFPAMYYIKTDKANPRDASLYGFILKKEEEGVKFGEHVI